MRGAAKPSSLRAGIVLSLISRFYAVGLALVCVPLYIRLIGIEAYGLYGLLSSYLVLAALLDLGLSSTLTHGLARARAEGQDGDRMRDLVRSLELPFWGVVGAGMALFLLAAPFLVAHWHIDSTIAAPAITRAVMLIGMTVALQLVLGLYLGGLTGLERQGLLNAIQVIAASLRYVGSVLVVWLISPAIDVFLAWQALVSALQLVILLAALRLSLPEATRRPRFRPEMLRSIGRFTLGMSGMTVVTAFLQQADKVILGAILPLDLFAHYAVATVITANLGTLVYPVFNATFARLSHLFARDDAAEIAEVFHKTSGIVALLLLPAAGIIAVFPTEVLTVWIGDRALAAEIAPVLRLLVLGAALNGLSLTPYMLIVAAGRSGTAFRLYLLALLGLAGATYGLALSAGAAGGATANLLCYAGIFIAIGPIAVARLRRGVLARWLLRDVLLPLLLTGGVAVAMRLVVAASAPRPTLLVALAACWALASLACAAAIPWLRQWLWQRVARAVPRPALPR
jgi:O-antigen/teichoic acid export membrane protein